MSRPADLRRKVMSVLRADSSPMGMLLGEIADAAGLTKLQASGVLYGARDAVIRFGTNGYQPFMRYVLAERAEACRPAFDAFMAALVAGREERRRQVRRARYDRDMERVRAERPPRPQKAAKAKPKAEPKPKHKQRAMTVAAPVHVPAKQPQKVAWANAVPIIPPHVKVTKCPGYTGDRWQVSVPVGGFVSEWKTLRSSRKAA